jgi:hypothetical protein
LEVIFCLSPNFSTIAEAFTNPDTTLQKLGI